VQIRGVDAPTVAENGTGPTTPSDLGQLQAALADALATIAALTAELAEARLERTTAPSGAKTKRR
jgi:hypothetical protein